MINRNFSSPILCVVVLSLVANPSLVAQTDPGVSNSTSSAPAPQPAPAATAGGVPAAPAPKHTTAYTVVKGDSLTRIAEKFNTTRKKLEALNNLTAMTVKPGQILLVPSTKSSKPSTATLTPKAKPQQVYLRAQPVQDFDIQASIVASRPAPHPASDEGAVSPTPAVAEKPAPIARLVSPAELAAIQPREKAAPAAPAPRVAVTPDTPEPRVVNTPVAPIDSAKHYAKVLPVNSTGESPAEGSKSEASDSPPVFNPPTSRLTSRSLNLGSGSRPQVATPANDWGNRFLKEARLLGDQGIEYDEDWRPPGESQAWTMDCSNTARYIYKVTTGIQLPRTASDQYYYLHQQGKAWDVPQAADGWADCNFLRHNLKPGDLLFWENTYRPERQPPITHVMVFLGTNARGQWIMAGSQTTRGGEHNRRNGGPDIYVFRPTQPCGGYTTWLGLVHHQGRFCAFGRPLDADRSKLAMAAND